MTKDRLGNVHTWGLPYAHGEIIRDSRDDHRKLREAWRHIAAREQSLGLDAVYNLSGLDRRYEAAPETYSLMDDELAPALLGPRLEELALEHLGGDPASDAIMVFNRQTAAILTATLVLVEPGQTVIGVSATGSHAHRVDEHRAGAFRRPDDALVAAGGRHTDHCLPRFHQHQRRRQDGGGLTVEDHDRVRRRIAA